MSSAVEHYDVQSVRTPLLLRLAQRAEEVLRPALGWPALAACALLAALPAIALRSNRWLELRGEQHFALELLGPYAVALVWLLMGWRQDGGFFRRGRGGVVARILIVLIVGLLIVSQTAAQWMPSVGEVASAVWARDFDELATILVERWSQVAGRARLWWDGVLGGGAAQDNLIFSGIAGSVYWLFGAITAWLARFRRSGLAAAGPVIWLIVAIQLYSNIGRTLLLTALAVAILLHLWLDTMNKQERWANEGLDFNPGLLTDRLFTVMGGAALILTVAAMFPSLYIRPIVTRYYQATAPMNEGMEALSQRLFPDLRGASRFRGPGGIGGGLPNEFLLRAGPALTNAEVMRVRTDEPIPVFDIDIPFEEVAPIGHYMRGGTFTVYDGRGWRNPSWTERESLDANTPRAPEVAEGRKTLVQSIVLSIATQVMYAAPEPIEASVDVRAEERSPGDLVALWSREGSYTVVSSIPAVNERMLMEEPAWGPDNPLPEEYEIHLQLPDSVTRRTRDLVEELTADKATPFEKARAIELHLRSYQYDLEVAAPPRSVDDVADYFLFELQRGYCDYYATAFVVMARIAGLPARFATGFAPGYWDYADAAWVVTEAEAHSWPEVYFPTYGWIPFEPTAGRAELIRIGISTFEPGAIVPAVPVATETAVSTVSSEQDWQMLFWLLPIGALLVAGVAGGRRWLESRVDPWTAVLRWGTRAGKPMEEAQTEREYGRELANFVLNHDGVDGDAGRIVAREVVGLSDAVSTIHYGPEEVREHSLRTALDHWQRLRGYLRVVRIR